MKMKKSRLLGILLSLALVLGMMPGTGLTAFAEETGGKQENPAAVEGAASVVRGGNTVDLADNVTLNGAAGAVSYAISGETNGCSLDGSVLTSGESEGTVTVNVAIAEDDNYNALSEASITVTITEKGTQTITAEDVTAVLGDTNKSVSATTDGDGAISYAVKEGSEDYIEVNAATGALTTKKTGTATIIVTAAETNTFAQATKEVTVTVNEANAATDITNSNNNTSDEPDNTLENVDDEKPVLKLGLMPGMSLTAYAAPTTVTWNASDITGEGGKSFTKDGITITCGWVFVTEKKFYGPGTFTTESGKFTKIEVTADEVQISGTGWSGNSSKKTWTGDASSSVSFNNDINDNSSGKLKIVFTIDPHTHSFTYSASGATLTATCTAAGCDLPPSTQGGTDHVAKLTLSAADAAYTGSAYTGASLSGTTAWTAAGLTAPTIEYAGRGSTSYTKSTTAPTNAGTYTASITVDTDKTATADFEIAKANPTAPTGLTATFRQTLANVTLPEGWTWIDSTQSVGNVVNPAATFKANFTGNDNYNAASNVDVTVTVGKADAREIMNIFLYQPYTLSTVFLSVANKMPEDAGTLTYQIGNITKTGNVEISDCTVDASYNLNATLSNGAISNTITVPITIKSTNYADSSFNVTISLTDKQPAKVTKLPEAKSLTANGSAQELVEAGEANGGTMKYALGQNGETVPTDGWSADIPKGTDAGTYYVWYKAEGDEDHSDSTSSVVPVTIAEAPIKPIEGNGFVWHKGSSDNSSIRFSSQTKTDFANVDTLTDVSVDEKRLVKDKDYKTSNGSVIVTFTKSYLEGLSVGSHSVVATFTTYSSEVKATFTVAEKPSSGGGSTPKKDNVVTCQMAGFPANYAWNEAAKACQPGYLDAGGNFHSYSNAKRSTVPNTSDNGNLTFYTIALFLMTLVAFVTAKTLTEDSTL